MLGTDIENCSKKMNFYHENYEFLGEKQASCNSPKMGLGAKKTPSVWSQHIPTFHTLFFMYQN